MQFVAVRGSIQSDGVGSNIQFDGRRFAWLRFRNRKLLSDAVRAEVGKADGKSATQEKRIAEIRLGGRSDT